MPKMTGRPEYGINQHEKSFDYDEFIPTSPPTSPPPETQDYENNYIDYDSKDAFNAFGVVINDFNARIEILSNNLDASNQTLLNDLNTSNETLSRSSRNDFNNQKYIEINNIKTSCPDKLKKIYELNGLSCTNLRKFNINFCLKRIRL